MMRFLSNFALALAIALSIPLCGCSRKHPPENIVFETPPNIIIYVIDSLRPDHLPLYGYFRDTAPGMSRFAEDAVTFTNARVQCSWTRPSVATLMTAKFPSSHGALDRSDKLSATHVTLPEVLKKQGYTTAAFVTNFNIYPFYGFGKGFDKFVEVPKKDGSNKPCATADLVNESIFKYLGRKPEGPLFLYIHTMDPHFPYRPPPPFDTKFKGDQPAAGADGKARPVTDDVNAYDGEIAFNDYYFDLLIEKLKELNLYENTLIFVLADHGEEFADHGGYFHGWTLYEEQLRVPLIVKLPRQPRSGTREASAVRIVDIFPTICALLGIEPPSGSHGASFSHLLSGNADAAWNPVVYAEERLDEFVLRSYVDDGYKLIEQDSPEEYVYLFNLKNDPMEKKDLAKKHPERVRMIRAAMDSFKSSLDHGFYLEIANGHFLQSRHRVEGYIEIYNGIFENMEFLGTEEDDAVVYDESKKTILFQYNLHNSLNPQPPPPGIIDVKRIRLTTSPRAMLKISLRVDGVAFPTKQVFLGSGKRLDKTRPFPINTAPDDSRLIVGADAFNPVPPYGKKPVCRIYNIPGERVETVKLNKKQKKILRDLGYIR